MQASLKEILTNLVLKQDFETISWADQKMPLLPRETERG